MLKLAALGLLSAFLLAGCSSQTMPPKLEGGSIAIGFPLDKATEQAKSDCGKKGQVPKLVYSDYQTPRFDFACLDPGTAPSPP